MRCSKSRLNLLGGAGTDRCVLGSDVGFAASKFGEQFAGRQGHSTRDHRYCLFRAICRHRIKRWGGLPY